MVTSNFKIWCKSNPPVVNRWLLHVIVYWQKYWIESSLPWVRIVLRCWHLKFSPTSCSLICDANLLVSCFVSLMAAIAASFWFFKVMLHSQSLWCWHAIFHHSFWLLVIVVWAVLSVTAPSIAVGHACFYLYERANFSDALFCTCKFFLLQHWLDQLLFWHCLCQSCIGVIPAWCFLCLARKFVANSWPLV